MSNLVDHERSLTTNAWAPRVYPDLIVDETADDVFLLHPTQPRWALTNRAGLALVRQFDGSRSLAEIAGAMSKHYALEVLSRIEDDLRAFTQRLHAANLLENMPLANAPSVATVREPHRLTIYITEECNLRCKHCFVVEGKMPSPKLTGDEVKRLIDSHLTHHPQALIMFSGGEAMVREDCIDLIEYTATKTDFVSLNTNGLLIDDTIAARLAKLPVYVQVSLDGADPQVHDFIRGKGTFEKTWQAIERLCAAGMASRVRTATTLTRCSLPQVRELVARVDALGVYEMRFVILNRLKAAVTNWDRIYPDAEELKAVYRYLLLELPEHPLRTKVEGEFPGFVPFPDPNGHHWCPLGETTILDSQGYTYPCPSLLTPEYRTGNVYNHDLSELEEGARARELRGQMLLRRYAIPECAACTWRNFCQGSCQAFSELRTGSTWTNDEFCEFRRELYREFARRQAQGRLKFHGSSSCLK